jgi:hypothetical protein
MKLRAKLLVALLASFVCGTATRTQADVAWIDAANTHRVAGHELDDGLAERGPWCSSSSSAACSCAAWRAGRRSPSFARAARSLSMRANQNGTALFDGITVLVLAQVRAVDLTLAQEVQMMLMSIIAGIGTAGVPGGSPS